jgi:hypothetical protein
MKAEYQSYLESLTITADLRSQLYTRIEEIIKLMEAMSPERADDIFISESIDSNSKLRSFYNLHLFTPSFVLQARNIQDANQTYFVQLLKNTVVSTEITQLNYNWQTATEESVLVLNANLGIHGGIHFRAASKNCDKLRKIYEERIKPNFEVR